MERGKRGDALGGLVGFPDSDFVVLMCGEERVVVYDERLDGRVGGCNDDNVGIGVGVGVDVGLEGERVSAACFDLAAGGGAVEEFAVEDEGGDRGGVDFDGGLRLLLLGVVRLLWGEGT